MSRKRRFTAEEAAQIITEDLTDAEYLDEVCGRIDEFLQNNDNLIVQGEEQYVSSIEDLFEESNDTSDVSLLEGLLNPDKDIDSDNIVEEDFRLNNHLVLNSTVIGGGNTESKIIFTVTQEEEEFVLNDTNITDIVSPVKIRSKKPMPSKWKQNISKKSRALGKEYLGKRLNKISGTWETVVRPERRRGALCNKESCRRHCYKFSDGDCKLIFTEFWKTGDSNIRRAFIRASVDVNSKSSATTGDSRRSKSRTYRLKKDGESFEICKFMFINSLGIGKRYLDNTLEENNIGVKPRNLKPTRSKNFKWGEEDQEHLADFFRQIPKAPGHYCRKD